MCKYGTHGMSRLFQQETLTLLLCIPTKHIERCVHQTGLFKRNMNANTFTSLFHIAWDTCILWVIE